MSPQPLDARSLTDEDLLDVVARFTVEVVPDLRADQLVAGGSLRDLGCNSVDRADIVSLCMEHLGVDIPPAEFAGVDDLDSLVTLFRQHIAP